MYINNAYIQKVLDVHLHKVHSTQSKSGVGSAKSPDELILSEKATDMQQIKQVLAGLPEVRTSLVQDLKHKVQSGAYQINEDETADSVVSTICQNIGKV